MQQELWLRARAQVLSSLSSCAMRAASDPHVHPLRTTEAGVRSGAHTGMPNGIAGAGHTHAHPHGSPRPGHLKSRASGHALAHANSHHHRDAVAGSDGLPEGFRLLHNPVKSSRSHQELHKELLLAHKNTAAHIAPGDTGPALAQIRREGGSICARSGSTKVQIPGT
ncbi:uncharacterized protein si:ch211-218o21.4 [Alosa alosa]|uniref:uncharacterized protein si:ch211-218o21.4 n=1 Tax=Alosa alosa TaxID=278164 RepID=UPI0020155553|nr:uncharacterized protein si:ch211-218o21.4 [Alosa alosa]